MGIVRDSLQANEKKGRTRAQVHESDDDFVNVGIGVRGVEPPNAHILHFQV